MHVQPKGPAMGDVGAPELLIILILLVALGGVVSSIWALIDAAMRPAWAFQGAGQNKTGWIIGLSVSWLLCLGWIPAWVYLLAIRSRLTKTQAAGPALRAP